MGRKGTGMGPTTECAVCGEQISKVFLTTHQKTKKCKIAGNKLALMRSGYRKVSNTDLAYRACDYVRTTHLGYYSSLVKREVTEYKPSRFGRDEEEIHTIWVPAWVHTLLEEEYLLTGELSDTPRLYGELVHRCLIDGEFRKVLEAAWRLGGATAIRPYVETPRMRAERLIERARRLQQEVNKLVAKAKDEDPSVSL